MSRKYHFVAYEDNESYYLSKALSKKKACLLIDKLKRLNKYHKRGKKPYKKIRIISKIY